MKLILIIILIFFSYNCAIKPHSFSNHLAMSASIGCEALDYGTTMYYVGKGAVQEANPLLKKYQYDPIDFWKVKGAIAGGVNTALWLMEDEHPKLAFTGYLINAITKCAIGLNNDRIAKKALGIN